MLNKKTLERLRNFLFDANATAHSLEGPLMGSLSKEEEEFAQTLQDETYTLLNLIENRLQK